MGWTGLVLAITTLAMTAACTGSPSHDAAPSATATPSLASGGAAGDCRASTSAVDVGLSATDPQPVVTVAPGTAINVTATAQFGDVTAPEVVQPGVACRSSFDVNGKEASATFVAERPGQTNITATVTGVDGGLARPVFSAKVIVRWTRQGKRRSRACPKLREPHVAVDGREPGTEDEEDHGSAARRKIGGDDRPRGQSLLQHRP